MRTSRLYLFIQRLRAWTPVAVDRRRYVRLGLAAGFLVTGSLVAVAIVTDMTLVGALHEPGAEEHGDQAELMALVDGGQDDEAFDEAFETGDELFETQFNAIDGVGANVGRGQRFSRIPRADLTGPGEWANHAPARATGPNAESCNACHSVPSDDGAGAASSNVHRDPLHSGNLGSFIQRNTPHVFAPGPIQRLAEEMTATLQGQRASAVQSACAQGGTVSVQLTAKGISFGVLKVKKTGFNPCTTSFDTTGVVGVSADLVVRPFQWKGSVAFLRDFNRGAAHNELGMQAVEFVGNGIDGDADGVVDEMTIGDMTSLAVYLAAQPRPTSKIELALLGLIPPLSSTEVSAIANGAVNFLSIGCGACHVPVLKLDDPIFSEPSQNANFRDGTFPAGQDPIAEGVDPAHPVRFDLTKDQPDNRILDSYGNVIFRLGSLRKDNNGKALVELFGDLKRHNMGSGLAESIDEVGTGASVFLTENLWGVGSTAPYLHDGRATTLTEAILEHGGESALSRQNFLNLSPTKKATVIAFLENLVLFKLPED